MTNYREAQRKRSERIFKEFDEWKEKLSDFLEENDASDDVWEAFRKCVRTPTLTHA